MPIVGDERREMRRRVREQIKHLARPIIIDVGSGGAPLPIAHIIVDKYPGGKNIDRNTNCLGYPGQIFVEADVEDLPFDNNAADFIWCSHVLEHVEHPDKAIAEMHRVSKQGAILIPPVEMEAIAQMTAGGEYSKGHRWLCRKRQDGIISFLRCNSGDKNEVRTMLRMLGCWPMVPARLYESAIFQGWGWNGWPERLHVCMEEPTTDILADWNTHFVMGGSA